MLCNFFKALNQLCFCYKGGNWTWHIFFVRGKCKRWHGNTEKNKEASKEKEGKTFPLQTFMQGSKRVQKCSKMGSSGFIGAPKSLSRSISTQNCPKCAKGDIEIQKKNKGSKQRKGGQNISAWDIHQLPIFPPVAHCPKIHHCLWLCCQAHNGSRSQNED